MRLTEAQYLEIVTRMERNTARNQPIEGEPPESESKLAEQIRAYCADQWPRWKIIQARRDKRSTIAVGAQDLTVFLPQGKVLCIELKSRTGKRTEAQLAWAAEMKMCGHVVHVVRTFEEFLMLVKITLSAASLAELPPPLEPEPPGP